MKHLPIGYKIQDGEIMIYENQAIKVRLLFEKYLEGYSLQKAAQESGIIGYHGTISRLLSNEKYIGALNYPQIISEEVFFKVQHRRKKTAQELGRDKFKEKTKDRIAPKIFTIQEQEEVFEDPYQEAIYKYSLIEIGEI